MALDIAESATEADPRTAKSISQEEAIAVLEQAAEQGTLTSANRRRLTQILDATRSLSGLNGTNLQRLREDLLTLEKCEGFMSMHNAEQRVIQNIFEMVQDENVRKLIGCTMEELLEIERNQEVSDEIRKKLSDFVESVLPG